MEIDVSGSLDPEPYNFSLKELVDVAMTARPDLKAAQLSERAADAAIRLQNAQRIPDLTLGGGMDQIPSGEAPTTLVSAFRSPYTIAIRVNEPKLSLKKARRKISSTSLLTRYSVMWTKH